MEKVERYFHIRPKAILKDSDGLPYESFSLPSSRGGATVRVTGDKDLLMVQSAFCSPNDAFCRATGRDVASKHPAIPCTLEQLPVVLLSISRSVTGRVLKLSRSKRQQHHLWNTDYSFAKKYFEPKKQLTTTE